MRSLPAMSVRDSRRGLRSLMRMVSRTEGGMLLSLRMTWSWVVRIANMGVEFVSRVRGRCYSKGGGDTVKPKLAEDSRTGRDGGGGCGSAGAGWRAGGGGETDPERVVGTCG